MAKSKVTPAGTAQWPRLNSPDTKFDEDGVYKTDLVLGAEESEDLREAIDQIAEEGWQNAIDKESKPAKKNALKKFNYHAPYFPEEDDQTGEETGNFVFRFKTKAKNKDGSTKKLPLVDAKKKPVGEIVGNGSTIKVAFSPNDYQMPTSKQYGCTLYLNAVQVLDLVAAGGGGASAFDEEDGFESEEAPEEVFAGASDSEDETDGDF
jgi:hypothetical protein